MFEFYEFNTMNSSIVLISTFIIYNMMGKINNDDKKSKEDDFNLEYLVISIMLSFIISLIIAYIITAQDEQLLTNSYWEATDVEN